MPACPRIRDGTPQPLAKQHLISGYGRRLPLDDSPPSRAARPAGEGPPSTPGIARSSPAGGARTACAKPPRPLPIVD
jgi:hypothetical protein